MQFIFIDEQTEKIYREILKKITLSMNGVAADLMREQGIKYEKNLGVSIVRLREIASEYQPSQKLSERLWKNNQRETRIMAFLLADNQKTSLNSALELAENINQPELAETGAMFLFSKLPFAAEFCFSCISSDKELTIMTGFLTAARIYENLTFLQCDEFITKAFNMMETDSYYISKSLGLFLSRMCRIDKKTAQKIQKEIFNLQYNNAKHIRLIKDMVIQEIDYFVHK